MASLLYRLTDSAIDCTVSVSWNFFSARNLSGSIVLTGHQKCHFSTAAADWQAWSVEIQYVIGMAIWRSCCTVLVRYRDSTAVRCSLRLLNLLIRHRSSMHQISAVTSRDFRVNSSWLRWLDSVFFFSFSKENFHLLFIILSYMRLFHRSASTVRE